MELIDHSIKLDKQSDRIEIFYFGDCHIGKRNCAESAIRKQVREVLKRSETRIVRVIFGGDLCDYVKPGDIKRFNINVLADWLVRGTPDEIRERLNDVADHQLKRALDIFWPIRHLAIGAIEGNHEYSMMHHNNFNMQRAFCGAMECPDLSDEALIRLRFSCKNTTVRAVVTHYVQHGHGGGRTAGAEPNKLARLQSDWENADIIMCGHTHTPCKLPPKPVLHIPRTGKLPEELDTRYRFIGNWGCWLYSHSRGPSSYESRASYPARPMMTMKTVIWPMYRVQTGGRDRVMPKIEMREYSIL